MMTLHARYHLRDDVYIWAKYMISPVQMTNTFINQLTLLDIHQTYILHQMFAHHAVANPHRTFDPSRVEWWVCP